MSYSTIAYAELPKEPATCRFAVVVRYDGKKYVVHDQNLETNKGYGNGFYTTDWCEAMREFMSRIERSRTYWTSPGVTPPCLQVVNPAIHDE